MGHNTRSAQSGTFCKAHGIPKVGFWAQMWFQVSAQDRNAVLASQVQNTVAGLAKKGSRRRTEEKKRRERGREGEKEREREQCDRSWSTLQMHTLERFGEIQTLGKSSMYHSRTQEDEEIVFFCLCPSASGSHLSAPLGHSLIPAQSVSGCTHV